MDKKMQRKTVYSLQSITGTMNLKGCPLIYLQLFSQNNICLVNLDAIVIFSTSLNEQY